MRAWVDRLGLSASVQSLNVVHIAGTKGKGSTSAMVEAILRGCGHRTALYTSPHLLDITERIRIDGEPISREKFAETFEWIDAEIKKHNKGYAMSAMSAMSARLGLVPCRG